MTGPTGPTGASEAIASPEIADLTIASTADPVAIPPDNEILSDDTIPPDEINVKHDLELDEFEDAADGQLLAATVNPVYAGSPARLNSQTLYLSRIRVKKPINAYQFIFSVEFPAEGVDFNSAAVIYDEDGAMLHSFSIGLELNTAGVKNVPFNISLEPGTYFLGIFVIAMAAPVLSAATTSGVANLWFLGSQARFLQSGIAEVDLPLHLEEVMLEASPYALFLALA